MSTRHGIRPRYGAGLAVAALSVTLLGACGSNDDSGSGTNAPAASGAALSATSSSLGAVLVNSTGRTVYYFAGDKGMQSQCNGACASNWPPVNAPSPLPASLDGVTGKLGSATRADGSNQLTVNGHPIYTFKGDSAKGQAKGQGKVLDGGLWTVVAPDGDAITSKAGSTPTAEYGGGGY
ncbi:COG4315 family predicted lipoprotein [Luteipulveratus mongoliensis]|uniref:Lipoprotein n=1 Tax=Luteipulveratus mongoliensis TaxID=571913 RepID=A0A0K1JH18_9MICO|nr:hypothetical protein [Luteipulveratus mongoliensis]AKU15996.1 hypothetical protein VV02_09230 [Luteipulveratus mongoliensis]